MAMRFEDLRVLRAAEGVADAVWQEVVRWKPFAQDVVGKQLARAADSIGANIAEAFGRFHYGEKLQFLYYARGSLFETKYWVNRSLARELMSPDQAQNYASQLTDLARQLNAFANTLKTQRHGTQQQPKAVREAPTEYVIDIPLPLFTEEELEWLNNI
jgi:four helix bundle protein